MFKSPVEPKFQVTHKYIITVKFQSAIGPFLEKYGLRNILLLGLI